MQKQRGFTLIELLVVIAIIGLLSTLAVVQLNSARAKARDARRLSDVKQMSTILEMEATEGTTYTDLTCTSALASTCTLPGQVSQFPSFVDPSTPATACTNASADTCGYAVYQAAGGVAPTVGDYQICFYLEAGAGSLIKGLNAIKTGGQFGTCL